MYRSHPGRFQRAEVRVRPWLLQSSNGQYGAGRPSVGSSGNPGSEIEIDGSVNDGTLGKLTSIIGNSIPSVGSDGRPGIEMPIDGKVSDGTNGNDTSIVGNSMPSDGRLGKPEIEIEIAGSVSEMKLQLTTRSRRTHAEREVERQRAQENL